MHEIIWTQVLSSCTILLSLQLQQSNNLGIGYLAVDDILPLEAILL